MSWREFPPSKCKNMKKSRNPNNISCIFCWYISIYNHYSLNSLFFRCDCCIVGRIRRSSLSNYSLNQSRMFFPMMRRTKRSLFYSHLCDGTRHGKASIVFLGVKVPTVLQRLEREKPIRLIDCEACRTAVPLHEHRVGEKREPTTYAFRPLLQVCRPLPFQFWM